MPQKSTDGRPIPIVTRQSINWRIPFDLITRIDEMRAETGQDRTAVVVAALQLYLATWSARQRAKVRVRRLLRKRSAAPRRAVRT